MPPPYSPEISIHDQAISSTTIYMQLNRKTEVGLTLMLLLACHERGAIMSSFSITNELQISASYLQQICKPLRKHKLIESHRGPNGGYQLSRTSGKITLAEIIEALTDEPKIAIKCLPTVEQKAWLHLNLGLGKHLDKISLKMTLSKYFQDMDVDLGIEPDLAQHKKFTFIDNLII